MSYFNHSLGFYLGLLNLALFLELDLQVMNPINILLLLRFELIHPIYITLLNVVYSS